MVRPNDPAPPQIVIDLQRKLLQVVVGTDTLMSMRVAVGDSTSRMLGNVVRRFPTPTGLRHVRRRIVGPNWTVPLWHYEELAKYQRLALVQLRPGRKYRLSDGTTIEVIGTVAGRWNTYGRFWPFEPGTEIVFDRTVFVPPLGSVQRDVPGAIGPFAMDLGDGYFVHGTPPDDPRLGAAITHGCIRVGNRDLTRLFAVVSVGTPVLIR